MRSAQFNPVFYPCRRNVGHPLDRPRNQYSSAAVGPNRKIGQEGESRELICRTSVA